MRFAAVLALAALSGCVAVTYQRPGQRITPRAGQSLFRGGHVSYGERGEPSVTVLPIDIARATREQRLGTLPQAPIAATWCAGEYVPGSPQADTSNPARVAIYGMGDTVIGYLVLGVSTAADAGRVLQASGGPGPARDNQVTFRIGPVTMRPRQLYTPPGTMHQLYFQNDTLVLVVDGMPHALPSTRVAFLNRFKAQETHRESGWYELQTPLTPCIWLIAVFRASTDTLESNAYAHTCY